MSRRAVSVIIYYNQLLTAMKCCAYIKRKINYLFVKSKMLNQYNSLTVNHLYRVN